MTNQNTYGEALPSLDWLRNHTLMLNTYSQPTTLRNRVADKELTVAQLVMKFLAIYDYNLYLLGAHKLWFEIFLSRSEHRYERKFLKTLRSVPTVSEELTVHDE